SIQKSITTIFDAVYEGPSHPAPQVAQSVSEYGPPEKMEATIKNLEKQMQQAARNLEFEQAAELRDRIKQLKQRMLNEG
ncbi:MAG: UvrB/UvrC motif-containing protein, partial [Desulfatitalea sp.]|nr:UvrB/UvrC motif-containing protein [Desulfatitalea sp.]